MSAEQYPPQYPNGGLNGQPNYTPPPSNHLAWAIITTLLCCLPFGIVSIVYAARVDSLWAQGRYADAQSASNNAKNWAIAAAATGAAGCIIYSILVFCGLFVSLI